MTKKDKETYMALALSLAAKAADKTYPNPMVGAVIVSGSRIIGKGYHEICGQDHAEVRALKSANKITRGATMFVTLEPCDHYGKTPPCTEAVIKSGIKKIYIAMKDPNPVNSGRGINKLRKHGIRVEVGLLREEAERLNKKYIKCIKEKMPYITVKLAQSLDGKIAARDGSSKWISSPLSRKYVKKIRSDFDGIIIGSGTLLEDDPFLLDEKKKGYSTARIIIDSRLRISEKSNIIKTSRRSPVILVTSEIASKNKIKIFNAKENVTVLVVKSKNGRVVLKNALKELAKKGFVNLLVEGGGEIVGSMIDEGLVDECIFFIAPKIIGGTNTSIKGLGVKSIDKALRLDDVEVKRFGEDVFVRGMIRK